jgi:hypothetical protein
MKECFNVSDTEPVVAAFADAVSPEHTNLAPQPDGIGMNVKQVGYFGHLKHPGWRWPTFVTFS